MKYGRFIYKYTGDYRTGSEAVYNIGDNIQTVAVDNLYRMCQIGEDDILDLNFTELAEYDDDYVIVPMAGYFSSYKEFKQLPVSSKIIPFFISTELGYGSCEDIIPFLKKWEPIGVRDEATLEHLRSSGIDAYLSGCLTITLPRRTMEPKNGRVFLIDISDEAYKYIPPNYLEQGIEVHHVGRLKTVPMDEDERRRIDETAIRTLLRYRDEASLVITSRLHAASPAIAMGIPTIVMCDNVDRRFAWLDKLIPLYDRSCYDKIDWMPAAPEIEDIKLRMIELFRTGLKRLSDKYGYGYSVSTYWEKRNKFRYDGIIRDQIQSLSEKFSYEDSFQYIIWGGGAHGARAYAIMKESFPNARLEVVVDKYLTGEVLGRKVIRADELKKEQFDYAIICTSPGRFEAKKRMIELGCKYLDDYCYFISQPKQAVMHGDLGGGG